MVRAVQPGGGSGGSSSSGPADVIDTILDKGLVIDAYIRVSLVGIELLTIEARIVVASVDTYLRFAEAVNRLDLSSAQEGLPGLVSGAKESGAKRPPARKTARKTRSVARNPAMARPGPHPGGPGRTRHGAVAAPPGRGRRIGKIPEAQATDGGSERARRGGST